MIVNVVFIGDDFAIMMYIYVPSNDFDDNYDDNVPGHRKVVLCQALQWIRYSTCQTAPATSWLLTI